MLSVQQLLKLGMDKQLRTRFEQGLITEPCPSLNAGVADRWSKTGPSTLHSEQGSIITFTYVWWMQLLIHP